MSMNERDSEDRRTSFDATSVNALPLPPALLDLLHAGRWITPDDAIMRSAIPFLRAPVDLLQTVEQMARESQGCLADDQATADLFHEYRGSTGIDKSLPWRDVDLSVLIAVNRTPVDDLGIALDYRSNTSNPSVIVSDWWTGDDRCHWREVSKAFEEFASPMRL